MHAGQPAIPLAYRGANCFYYDCVAHNFLYLSVVHIVILMEILAGLTSQLFRRNMSILESESDIAAIGNLVALAPEGPHTAGIGHEHSRFSDNFVAHVVRRGLGIQGLRGRHVDVVGPTRFGFGRDLHRASILCFAGSQHPRQPGDVLFDREQNITEQGGAAGAGDEEEVRKAFSRQTEIGDRTCGPFVPERPTISAADVRFQQ